ncbi:aldehyde dehydrogenase family 3 member B1 [Notolabrus celidotus]|uniref:aldehyde dehydrogenase family 3 member B1 n=1 Tax=Notolabrus celidotus TaxID=1203425 RepID=UPI00148FC896|nr:aldehyde dehydrogenase family 3 member B1 [Notolabrus celidotus]XP_034568054.1 aldehyde dehydrogenase family 3 member B1 [Notolabrus celidotus]
MEAQSQVVDRLRTAFRSRVTIPEEFRRAQLIQVMAMITENQEAILEALQKDLSKPRFEAVMSEVDIVINDIHHVLDNFSSWMKLEYAAKNFATKLDTCFVKREPLGVVLIIGPWNYPLQLLMIPLVEAIAAGNCVLLKPSEVSPHTGSLVAELIPKYLHQDCFAVVCGGVEETVALLKNRFDHIFYTGSKTVARSILQAAAVHLTPVTLELGGKCPCLITGRVNMAAAARRLVWAKFFNAGQSCIAPDHVICSEAIRDALLPEIRKSLEDFYGKEPEKCPDMGRIVSPRHWTRLMGMLRKTNGKIVHGGEGNEEDKYIAPTVVIDVSEDDALMADEILGPILPILTIETLQESIDFMNRGDTPLALYVFTEESSIVNTVLENTKSGGFCSNDGIVHMALPTLPFGGIGGSGIGSYHGRWGFETFSHRRGCLLRGWAMERLNILRYPPYSEEKMSWIRWTTSPKSSCSIM